MAMVLARRLVIALAAAWLVAAAARPAAAEPGDDLAVYVLTFGPGDHPFFKFGHNAIWIRPQGQEGLVFNFGTFAFDTPGLIPKFLRGRLTYWLSVSPAAETLASYQESDRTIRAQELDLLPAERLELYRRLMDNARPDKRAYLYDYFWDNCSTRVRDAVDAIVGGAVRGASHPTASMSLRAHALRMVADLPWEYVALHFGLGSRTDAPISRWQEAFLPDKLHDLLAAVRVPRADGLHALVRSDRVLYASRGKKPPLDQPPTTAPTFAIIGLALGGALAFAGTRARDSRAARVALGVSVSLLGLVAGLLGTILVLLWTLTNHRAAHANANIWQCAPILIALVGFGIGVARGRARSARRAFVVVAIAALASFFGVVTKPFPGATQDNLAFIALFLPLWVGLAYGLRAMTRRAVAP